jgi:calcineurin-like phosphoesterase family protein
MNKTLIDNWNGVVKPDDTVFHLGDFGFGSLEQIEAIVKQLNGKIILILGNHDKKSVSKFLSMGFYEVHKKPITMGNYILSHRPIDNVPYDIINIHGHIHNTYFPQYDNQQYINVSAEIINYTPIKLDSIIMEG